MKERHAGGGTWMMKRKRIEWLVAFDGQRDEDRMVEATQGERERRRNHSEEERRRRARSLGSRFPRLRSIPPPSLASLSSALLSWSLAPSFSAPWLLLFRITFHLSRSFTVVAHRAPSEPFHREPLFPRSSMSIPNTISSRLFLYFSAGWNNHHLFSSSLSLSPSLAR